MGASAEILDSDHSRQRLMRPRIACLPSPGDRCFAQVLEGPTAGSTATVNGSNAPRAGTTFRLRKTGMPSAPLPCGTSRDERDGPECTGDQEGGQRLCAGRWPASPWILVPTTGARGTRPRYRHAKVEFIRLVMPCRQ